MNVASIPSAAVVTLTPKSMAVNKIRKISENRSEEKEEEFSMAVREKEESTIQVSESEFR